MIKLFVWTSEMMTPATADVVGGEINHAQLADRLARLGWKLNLDTSFAALVTAHSTDDETDCVADVLQIASPPISQLASALATPSLSRVVDKSAWLLCSLPEDVALAQFQDSPTGERSGLRVHLGGKQNFFWADIVGNGPLVEIVKLIQDTQTHSNVWDRSTLATLRGQLAVTYLEKLSSIQPLLDATRRKLAATLAVGSQQPNQDAKKFASTVMCLQSLEVASLLCDEWDQIFRALLPTQALSVPHWRSHDQWWTGLQRANAEQIELLRRRAEVLRDVTRAYIEWRSERRINALAVVGSMGLVMSIVVGYFGMNFEVMWRSVEARPPDAAPTNRAAPVFFDGTFHLVSVGIALLSVVGLIYLASRFLREDEIVMKSRTRGILTLWRSKKP